MNYQQIPLEQQIADYQAIAQQAKSAGRKLIQRLHSLGWTMLERVFDYDGIVMISPELKSHEQWETLAYYDEEEGQWIINVFIARAEGDIDWSDHIVELSVID